MLGTIQPLTDKITHACHTLQMRAGIMVVIRMTGYQDLEGINLSTAAIGYASRTIQRVARLNLELHHDQYVLIDTL